MVVHPLGQHAGACLNTAMKVRTIAQAASWCERQRGRGPVVFTNGVFDLLHVGHVSLLEAARAVRAGNLSHRVKTDAIDEFATLVRSFNDMVPRLQDQLRMHESLQLANEVQQNLLPKHLPPLPQVEAAGVSIYCDETGGDYYDLIVDPNDPSGAGTIVVGDVSGHGAHAALLMASARAGLRIRSSLPSTADSRWSRGGCSSAARTS